MTISKRLDERKLNKQQKIKRYNELTISDVFMFYKVMQNPELCKELLDKDKWDKSLVTPRMENLLRYIEEGKVTDEYTEKLESEVSKVKKDYKVSFMRVPPFFLVGEQWSRINDILL